MNKSKQEWEAEQKSKNPAVTQQELDTQWESKNAGGGGWKQSLKSFANNIGETARGIGPVVKKPTLSDTVNSESAKGPNPELFNPDNFAKQPDKEPPTTEPTSLASTLSAPAAHKDAPVGPSEAKRNYDKINKELLGYKAKELPEDLTQQIRADLKQAYEDKVSRNDWAEIATNLVNAMATYGAAKQAGDKYDGGIRLSPGIDYNAKSDRAAREYSTGLSEQDKIVATKQRAVDSSNDNEYRNLTLRQRLAKDSADLETDTERNRKSDADKARAAEGSMTDREKLEERRGETTRLEEKQLTINEDEAMHSMEAIADASGKEKDKLISKQGGILSKAGISPADIKKAESDNMHRTLRHPIDGEPDQDGVQKSLWNLIVLRRSKNSSPEPQKSPSQQPSQHSTGKTPVTVVHKPTGAIRQFPADSVELQNALKNPEFEVK